MLSRYYIKQIFIVFTVTFLFSCELKPTEEGTKQPNLRLLNLNPEDFEIIVIDDCEYLLFEDDFNHASKGFGFMSHKGNCANPVHFHNTLDTISNTLEVKDKMPNVTN